MAKYRVANMRVLPGNPDKGIAVIVKGEFTDENGTLLAIKSKSISVEERAFCKVNLAKGTLEMPDAKRGRPVKQGMTQEEIDSLLSA
jgi:hypothetical protein